MLDYWPQIIRSFIHEGIEVSVGIAGHNVTEGTEAEERPSEGSTDLSDRGAFHLLREVWEREKYRL